MKDRTREYQKLFISETRDELDQLNQAMVQLEKSPGDFEIITEMLRLCHTIKGNASAMEYEDISQLAHSLEEVFITIRDKKQPVTTEITDTLFQTFDLLSDVLASMKKRRPRSIDLTAIQDDLNRLIGQKSTIDSPRPVLEDFSEKVELSDALKVPVKKLDELMNLVGELVIDGSHIVEILSDIQESATKETLSHFRRVITDIQDNVMGLRMVPVATMFSKFPRLVRDLARNEGKDIELILEGEDTELDRTILEKLSDPILHLIRNAVDHGMETPDERERQGKEKTGQIKLTARREKQIIVLEITDDGRGINIDKVKQRAIETGLVSEATLGNWRPDEILNLICSPGFSLAKTTTTVSGRGIGMDVVKSGVVSLGGELRLQSVFKQGTTIRMEIPPSVAVIKALLFGIASETYALPLLNVRHLRVIENSELHQIGSNYMAALEEKTLPALFLEKILSHDSGKDGAKGLRLSDSMNLLIAESGEREIGLITGDLINIQDIVVKPLKGPVSHEEYFSGATILGSGELCLIIDLAGILRKHPMQSFDSKTNKDPDQRAEA